MLKRSFFFSSTSFFSFTDHFISRWVGRLRTVGLQRDTQQEETTATSEFEFLQRTDQHHHHRDRSGSSSTQFDEADQDNNMPSSPFFSASSTVWGSNSIPSTPARGTFTPVYAGSGGTASPAMTIPIGAMSLSSRYETPRSGILSLADEEEEVGVEGERDGMVKQDESGQVRDIVGDEEDGKGLKMDVDVDADVPVRG